MAGCPRPYPTYRPSGVLGLGDIPEHWRVRKVRDEAQIVNGYPFDAARFSPTDGYPLIRIRDLNRAHTATRYAGPFVEAARVEPGDVLIGMDGDFNVGIWAGTAPGLLNQRMCCVRGRLPVTTQLLRYALPGPLREINEVTWSTTVKHLSSGQVERIAFACPPPAEQAAIVRFLDHENRRIRRYIAAKKRLNALLNEQKQAIINRAVTRGLDPDVRLKPSGVEWLGDVPDHWQVVRAKRLFSPRRDLALPDDVQLSSTQAYGVIPQAEFEAKVGRRVVRISMHLERRRHVEKDDFVISMRSFQGGLERAWATGAIRSSYVVLRAAPQADVGFFSYLFKSRSYIRALQATADFIRDGQDLNFGNFCGVSLPLVPLGEQQEIAASIAGMTTSIDVVLVSTGREIALLREYGTRLIADVVTGKLDVREAAAQLPDEGEEAEPPESPDDLADGGEFQDDAALDAVAEEVVA